MKHYIRLGSEFFEGFVHKPNSPSIHTFIYKQGLEILKAHGISTKGLRSAAKTTKTEHAYINMRHYKVNSYTLDLPSFSTSKTLVEQCFLTEESAEYVYQIITKSNQAKIELQKLLDDINAADFKPETYSITFNTASKSFRSSKVELTQNYSTSEILQQLKSVISHFLQNYQEAQPTIEINQDDVFSQRNYYLIAASQGSDFGFLGVVGDLVENLSKCVILERVSDFNIYKKNYPQFKLELVGIKMGFEAITHSSHPTVEKIKAIEEKNLLVADIAASSTNRKFKL